MEDLEKKILRFQEKHAIFATREVDKLSQKLAQQGLSGHGSSTEKINERRQKSIRDFFNGFFIIPESDHPENFVKGIKQIYTNYFSTHPEELQKPVIKNIQNKWVNSSKIRIKNLSAGTMQVVMQQGGMGATARSRYKVQISTAFEAIYSECIDDLIEALTEQFDQIQYDKTQHKPATKIDITNIRGVTIIGDGNIVNTNFTELYKSLDSLKTKVLESKEYSQQNMATINADLQTIQAQLAKEKPNKSIILLAWEGIKGLVTAQGFHKLVNSISDFIETIPM